jgi:site-specific recombinase XerD
MREDMQVRNLSPHTQRAYIENVARFARHFGRSPADLGPEEIRTYQVYLIQERHLAPSSLEIAVCALRFLYHVTLKRSWSADDVIPAPKKPRRLPVVLSPDEVVRALACVASPKHRAVLTTCYAAGLRISEAVRLRPRDVDSQRMVMRIEQGKGQRDRYVMLSPKLLEVLRAWWRLSRPTTWLFPGDQPDAPIGRGAVEQACHHARRRAGLTKLLTPHVLRSVSA